MKLNDSYDSSKRFSKKKPHQYIMKNQEWFKTTYIRHNQSYL